ncbi:MAG: hypothetical protein ACE37F_23010 [Nannocystaceae bacterium]|nr:hypothetical protein [bacterium]
MTLLLPMVLCAASSAAPSAPQDEARPPVHLVVDQGLTDWLLVRLLADGYPLAASAEHAQVELSVRPAEDAGWVVMATGSSSVSFQVETSSDPAVTRLELLHRSLDALEDVEPSPAPTASAATVALAVDDGATPELAAQVAVDILAAGATLVPMGADAQLRVCAAQRQDSEDARVWVVDGGADCATAEEPGASVFDAVHVASTTQRVEAAIADLQAEDEPEPEPSADELPQPPPTKDEERPPGLEGAPAPTAAPKGRRRRTLRGGLGVGMLARIRNVDPLLLGSATLGREPGVQGWFELQVRPVNVVDPLKVVEVVPSVGLQVRPVSVGRFALITGGLGGVDIHRWFLRANGGSSRGTDVSLSGELMLGAAIAVWKDHEVQLSLRAGWSPGRAHTFDGEEIWRRHPLRLGLMAGFMFGRKVGT